MKSSEERDLAAEREICGLVSELARRIDDHVRQRVVQFELTGPQAVALRELTGPMTMRELALRMGCEPSNVTYVADRLEEQGVIERQAHPHDRRAKRLALTAHGAALREQLIEVLSHDSPDRPVARGAASPSGSAAQSRALISKPISTGDPWIPSGKWLLLPHPGTAVATGGAGRARDRSREDLLREDLDPGEGVSNFGVATFV
jgi:DNA-binding MarR family transcriptional regulator